jgi:hypothetical protein
MTVTTPEIVVAFEFIDHGFEHPDFFQGCGVALTRYDHCFTGIGNTPYEAGHEALDLASHDFSWNDALMNEAENWVEKHLANDVEAFEPDSEAVYHVSIRIKTLT